MKSWLLASIIAATAVGCNPKPANHDTPNPNPLPDDSTQVVSLLKNMYRWHDNNQVAVSDFFIIVKDTAQVGVNYDSLTRRMGVLRQTNFFSRSFLDMFVRRIPTSQPLLWPRSVLARHRPEILST